MIPFLVRIFALTNTAPVPLPPMFANATPTPRDTCFFTFNTPAFLIFVCLAQTWPFALLAFVLLFSVSAQLRSAAANFASTQIFAKT